MKRPTVDEQRQLVRQWRETGQELERIREQALRGLPYKWEDVDALLALGDTYNGPPRRSSGLEEMQRIFMRAAPDWYLKAREERMRKKQA